MKCQTCHGVCLVETRVRGIPEVVPCPNCIGGEDHCCSGDTACNEYEVEGNDNTKN
jgi:hypothetical protein